MLQGLKSPLRWGDGELPLASEDHVQHGVESPHSEGALGKGQAGGGGPHLQVLLLPGEGIGEPLCGLGSVLRHLGLDGVCDLLEHRVDLFQEATGLINVIQLGARQGRGTHVIC